jgi:hypothetical protein
LYVNRWYIYAMAKVRKNFRITHQLLERAAKVMKPHQTETDFVEDAMYEKVLREEEEAKRGKAAA